MASTPQVSAAEQPETPAAEQPARTRVPLLRGLLTRVKADSLLRSSSLLVIDYLIIGAIGGICMVIAARGWSTYDVGVFAALSGVASLLSTATSSGLGSTITRFLGVEGDQLDFMLEAMIVSVLAGAAVSAAVCFVPGHFGVPIHDLPAGVGVAFVLIGGYVVTNNMTAVTDPAFIARKEVSYAVAKDIAASLLRIVILILFIGTNAVGLFGASVTYVAVAAVMDIGLIAWRLRNHEGLHRPLLRFPHLRPRLRFTLSSQSASLVAVVPGSLFATIAAAFDGPTVAAEVGIPLMVASYVTIIPSMTSQALLAELSDRNKDAASVAVRALRLCYTGTVPAALLLEVLAPWVLLIFGHRYSVHGAGYLRWAAASTLLSTSNYVTDTVLLAREKMFAYNLVNGLGAAAVLACVVVAAMLGPFWLGPAIVAGQLLYLLFSIIAVLRYTTPRHALDALGSLTWRM